MHGKKTLEVNPDHPAIKELRERVLKHETPPSEVEDTALLLYDTAILTSGSQIEDPNEFALRMDRALKYNLNVDRFEKSTPFEVEIDEEPEEKPKEDGEHKHEEGAKSEHMKEEL